MAKTLNNTATAKKIAADHGLTFAYVRNGGGYWKLYSLKSAYAGRRVYDSKDVPNIDVESFYWDCDAVALESVTVEQMAKVVVRAKYREMQERLNRGEEFTPEAHAQFMDELVAVSTEAECTDKQVHSVENWLHRTMEEMEKQHGTYFEYKDWMFSSTAVRQACPEGAARFDKETGKHEAAKAGDWEPVSEADAKSALALEVLACRDAAERKQRNASRAAQMHEAAIVKAQSKPYVEGYALRRSSPDAPMICNYPHGSTERNEWFVGWNAADDIAQQTHEAAPATVSRATLNETDHARIEALPLKSSDPDDLAPQMHEAATMMHALADKLADTSVPFDVIKRLHDVADDMEQLAGESTDKAEVAPAAAVTYYIARTLKGDVPDMGYWSRCNRTTYAANMRDAWPVMSVAPGSVIITNGKEAAPVVAPVAPVRIVLDITGGAVQGLYAGVPVEAVMVSYDRDDVAECRADGIATGKGDVPMSVGTGGEECVLWTMSSGASHRSASANAAEDTHVVGHFFNELAKWMQA